MSYSDDARSQAVPMPKRLFSTISTSGSFQSAAMLSDSWKAPWFTAASPR
jgi:hypothetical protein